MNSTRQMFPRVKPIYPVYRLDEETFRIGAQLGITAEFEDSNGQLWTLVHLLDGSRNLQQVCEEMRSQYPDLSDHDIKDGISTLDQEGFIENASVHSDTESAQVNERYVGNVNYFSHYAGLSDNREDYQRVLEGSKVALFGLGGAGSNILAVLAATGIGQIVAVDYDRVERTNLNRQYLYREADIGSLKTEAASEIMATINSDLAFSTVTQKITSASEAFEIIQGMDLVICAIDEPPFLAQRIVNRASVRAGVPCVFAAMQVTRARVFSVVPKESGCFDCLNIHYALNDPQFTQQFQGFHQTNFDPPTIAFAPNIIQLCGAVAAEAVLTGYQSPITAGTQFELDFEAGTGHPLLSWPRYPEKCPTCGTGKEEDWVVFSYYPGSL